MADEWRQIQYEIYKQGELDLIWKMPPRARRGKASKAVPAVAYSATETPPVPL